MANSIFLVDANAFLTPSKYYYRFSIAPTFWEKFNSLAEEGRIKTIDKIDKELRPRKLERLKDDIQLWYEHEFKGEVISTKREAIINEYIKVIQFLDESPKYNHAAFLEWARREDVADPWLLATAKVHRYTIVTFETKIQYSGAPMSKAKIPNVCEDLEVNYTDLYTMMERLEIVL